jgi:hypothetical protein
MSPTTLHGRPKVGIVFWRFSLHIEPLIIGFKSLSGAGPDLKLADESLGRLNGDRLSHRFHCKGRKQSEWNTEQVHPVRLIRGFPNVTPDNALCDNNCADKWTAYQTIKSSAP